MLKYKVQARKLNYKGDKKVVYSAALVGNGEVSFKELKEEVASITSLGKGDCDNAITTLTELMTKHLNAGRTVVLGDFGRFRVSLNSKSVERAEDWRSHHIKKAKVLYVPGKDIRNAMKTAGVELVDPCGASGTCKPNGKDSLEEQPV